MLTLLMMKRKLTAMPQIPRIRSLTKLIGLVVAMAILIPATGCIRSRVHITSDPEGAEVTFRGEPRGATPITIPFIWYWYYDFTLDKPGYEHKEVLERFRTPPWFLMPLDFFMEILPIPIPDTRERHYVLQKKAPGVLEVEPTGIDLQKALTTPAGQPVR